MKKLMLGLVLAMALVAPLAFAAAPTTSMSEVEMYIPKMKPMTNDFYSDGTQSRMEMYNGTGSGKTLTMITINKGDYVYMLTPASKTAMKMSAKAGQGQGPKKEEPPKCDKWEDCMKQNKEVTVTNRGKETWNGQEYTVYRSTDNKTKDYVDYYVDSKGMVKRYLSYNAKGELVAESRIIKMETGKPLPAGSFDIPSDYKIMDMSNMPGMPH